MLTLDQAEQLGAATFALAPDGIDRGAPGPLAARARYRRAARALAAAESAGLTGLDLEAFQVQTADAFARYATAAPTCTPGQGQRWQARYSDGYQAGRGDARRGAGPRIPLIDVPEEDPYETGARYVTVFLPIAWEIGYTRAYTYETRR